MFDLPTKNIDEMRRSGRANYSILEEVAKKYMDSGTGVELNALLELIDAKKWSLRNFAKKKSIRISILSDADGKKYVFFKSK
jgi:histidinol phosphatase-like PHP family hydrolase